MLITPYIILFGIESHDRLLVIEEQRGRQEKTISRRDERGGLVDYVNFFTEKSKIKIE